MVINKGYMTFAADMVILRQERFVERVELVVSALFLSLITDDDNKNKERIVNRDGKVVAKYWIN